MFPEEECPYFHAPDFIKKNLVKHTAQIWISMAKRPGVTSDAFLMISFEVVKNSQL